MKRSANALWISLVTLAFAACAPPEPSPDGAGGGAASEGPRSPTATDAPPPGASPRPAGDLAPSDASGTPAALRAAYIAAVQNGASDDYRIETKADGLEAANAAQQLRIDFTPQGIAVAPTEEGVAWSWHIATSRFGCEGELADVESVAPAALANRVDYHHAALDAWYVNGPLGLEQGFTLAAPPPCGSATGRSVVIELEGDGDVTTEVSEKGDTAKLRAPNGKLALRYTDLYVVDAIGKQLPARFLGGENGLSIWFDDAGAVYPVEVDPLLWGEEAVLLASDGVYPDRFGTSVAISGDTAIVGAPNAGAPLYFGAAYVFVRSGATWTQQQKLTAGGGGLDEQFGMSVAVSGDTAIVGAPGNGLGQGAAYVFVRSGGTWTQLGSPLFASAPTAQAQFGRAVALRDDTAVIGAPCAGTDLTGNALGAAYVFSRSGGVWSQQAELAAIVPAATDWFGFGLSVAVGADTVVVGGKAADVFVRTGITWTPQQHLVSSGGIAPQFIGSSVGISGNTLIVGVPYQDGVAGRAYVFVRSGSTWTEQQALTGFGGGTVGDSFGTSVAISGDRAMVSELGFAIGGVPSFGAVWMFNRSGVTWDATPFSAWDGAPNDGFGASVAIDGPHALVGAPYKASSRGQAYILVAVECATVQAVADTQIGAYSSGSEGVDTNYGAVAAFNTGLVGGVERNALLRFDVSGIPPGAEVAGSLIKGTLRESYSAATVNAHRITAPWDEATVTWSNFGGAFSPSVEGSFPVTSGVSVATNWYMDVTPLVQSWASGTPNYGVLLEQGATPYANYYSREDGAQLGPALSYCYVVE